MTSVTEKGQVTIPKEIRERAGISPGDDLKFEVEGDRITVRKNPEENPFEKWKDTVKTDRTTGEIMEEIRGEDSS